MEILNENPKPQTIKTADEWFCYCPPEGGEKQWKDDHSAKEFAKLVTSPDFENEVCQSLAPKFGKCSIKFAYPERQTSFDKFGAPRHHDLACIANSETKNIALGFEAKVNEPFHDILKKHVNELEKNPNSNIRKRVNLMTQRFWKKTYDENAMGNLQYQLLTGLTGTIFFAEEKECKKCVFVIYQIETNLTDAKCIEEHEKAVLDFLKMFDSNLEALRQNEIYSLGKYKADKSEIETYLLYMKRKKIN